MRHQFTEFERPRRVIARRDLVEHIDHPAVVGGQRAARDRGGTIAHRIRRFGRLHRTAEQFDRSMQRLQRAANVVQVRGAAATGDHRIRRGIDEIVGVQCFHR